MRIFIVFVTTILTLGLLATDAFAAEGGGTTPTFKMSGDVALLSHYVEYGLSQSDKTPALQGSFWFNLGSQFRLGLWGSNTNYEHSDDHFNLRFSGDIRVDFTQNNNMVIAYSRSQYYNGGDRNGDLIGVRFNFTDYRVTYDYMSNWEGTKKSSNRFGFGKLTKVFTTWEWDNEAGYNAPGASGINPYFDLRTALGTKWEIGRAHV